MLCLQIDCHWGITPFTYYLGVQLVCGESCASRPKIWKTKDKATQTHPSYCGSAHSRCGLSKSRPLAGALHGLRQVGMELCHRRPRCMNPRPMRFSLFESVGDAEIALQSNTNRKPTSMCSLYSIPRPLKVPAPAGKPATNGVRHVPLLVTLLCIMS